MEVRVRFTEVASQSSNPLSNIFFFFFFFFFFVFLSPRLSSQLKKILLSLTALGTHEQGSPVSLSHRVEREKGDFVEGRGLASWLGSCLLADVGRWIRDYCCVLLWYLFDFWLNHAGTDVIV